MSIRTFLGGIFDIYTPQARTGVGTEIDGMGLGRVGRPGRDQVLGRLRGGRIVPGVALRRREDGVEDHGDQMTVGTVFKMARAITVSVSVPKRGPTSGETPPSPACFTPSAHSCDLSRSCGRR